MNFKDYKEEYYYQPNTIVKGQSIFKKTNLAGIMTHCSHWKDNKCDSIRGENEEKIYLYIPCNLVQSTPCLPLSQRYLWVWTEAGGGGRIIYQKIQHVPVSQSSLQDGSADVTAIWDQV